VWSCCGHGGDAWWVLVEGDFLWRLSLLLGSLFVVTSSCLWFLGLFRCLGCLEEAGPVVLSYFLLICFVVCTTSYHVVCHTFCVLVAGGPVNFDSRSGVGV
jgi:hypothetical protein